MSGVVNTEGGSSSGSQPSDHFLSGSAAGAPSSQQLTVSSAVPPVGPFVTSSPGNPSSARQSARTQSSSRSSLHTGINRFMNKIKSSVPFVNPRAFNWFTWIWIKDTRKPLSKETVPVFRVWYYFIYLVISIVNLYIHTYGYAVCINKMSEVWLGTHPWGVCSWIYTWTFQ